MLKRHAFAALVLLITLTGARLAAHCEIPCGIYDDPMRMRMIYENIQTLAKCIHEIGHLEEADKPNANQLTRWIMNKDEHANQLQHILTQYFMTQRITPVPPGDAKYDKYLTELTLLHAMLVQAMKAKQGVDPAVPRQLTELARQFEMSYFGKTVVE